MATKLDAAIKLGSKKNSRLGSGRNLSKDCVEKIKKYLDFVQDKAKNYEPKSIYAFDETSFYMDAVGSYSI